MTGQKPHTLKAAQQSGKLAAFIAERSDTPPGDLAAFDACLTSMAGTRKPRRGTSPREPSEG